MVVRLRRRGRGASSPGASSFVEAVSDTVDTEPGARDATSTKGAASATPSAPLLEGVRLTAFRVTARHRLRFWSAQLSNLKLDG